DVVIHQICVRRGEGASVPAGDGVVSTQREIWSDHIGGIENRKDLARHARRHVGRSRDRQIVNAVRRGADSRGQGRGTGIIYLGWQTRKRISPINIVIRVNAAASRVK